MHATEPPCQELPVLGSDEVEAGLKQKAEEFRASGGELYVKEPAGAE